MTISYNWIAEYIPVTVDPERISKILTSIGLEVESLEQYESIRGGLKGLVVGQVVGCEQHPAADRLKLTRVDTGDGEIRPIVCGAPNVAVGQKVIVAKPGATLYPAKGDPITLKVSKIRGVESFGMLCAADEVGLGDDHEGIVVLPADAPVGKELSGYLKPYSDWIYEIGLTPNRMDAMSHLGVARDICAYLNHHDKQDIRVKNPYTENGPLAREAGSKTTEPPRSASDAALHFKVTIENTQACQRYSGISIAGVTVGPSPQWLQDKLKAIGQRPINNIVDITNFILHDTGQPLHAFDADAIAGGGIRVKNLPQGTTFRTLDEKDRKLHAEDLMICDGNSRPLCIAGVFGGADSGVKIGTRNLFLESAWFNPVDIRKTSFRHGLRTDAAARFEKNVDISQTAAILKHAAKMITEIAGGEIVSGLIDVYPSPGEKTEINLKYHYLKKLSGKNYHPDTVRKILQSLGFEVIKEGMDDIRVAAPFSKPDITLQADVVEEIMRIDGYDNIAIPSSITITPSAGAVDPAHIRREKTAGYLAGAGFHEIFTNSITNADYFTEEDLRDGVRLLNNLSVVHNIMRPSMLQTGLESVAYNLNRKNQDLKLFEFGKTYRSSAPGQYHEEEHLCLYVTGQLQAATWKNKSTPSDIYYLKGVVETVLRQLGISRYSWEPAPSAIFKNGLALFSGKEKIALTGTVHKKEQDRFGIRQELFYADIHWDLVKQLIAGSAISFSPLPNQLPVHRDLAMVVDKALPYASVESAVRKTKLDKLQSVALFDVFENEKLGKGKKSLAISLTFLDRDKTLTDKEIDNMMSRIMRSLEQAVGAEIRKGS